MKGENRLVGLDALRGVASFIVAFFWHYQHYGVKGEQSPGYSLFPAFFEKGWFGVEFFFVLSGFIFSYVYKEKIAAKGLSELRRFVVHRIARLYPLHFLTLLIVAAFVLVFGPFVYPQNTFSLFVQNVLFLQFGWFSQVFSFNGPAWSVSCELLLYGVFFVVSWRFSKYSNWIYILLIALGLYLKTEKMDFPIFNESMGRALLCFPVGCLVYEASRLRLLGTRAAKIFLLLVVAGSLVYPFFWSWNRFLDWELKYIFLCFPGLILLFAKSQTVARWTSNRFCKYLGDMSFTVYLMHYPMQFLIHVLNVKLSLGLDFATAEVFVLNIVLTLLASTAIFRYYEKPMDGYLKKKWLARS